MRMKNTIAPLLYEPSEPEIQASAYRLWVGGGCRGGVECDNGFAAPELLRQRGRAPAQAAVEIARNIRAARN